MRRRNKTRTAAENRLTGAINKIYIKMSLILRHSKRLLQLKKNTNSTNNKQAMMMMNVIVQRRSYAGMGAPTGTAPPPETELEEEHELIWDAGDKHPETALDNLPAKIVGKYEALGMIVGALCLMGGVYTFAGYYDKASSQPFASRDLEKHLQSELGQRRN